MFKLNRLSITMLVSAVFVLIVSGVGIADEGGYFGTDYDLGGATVTIGNWSGSAVPARFLEGGLGEGLLEEAQELFNCTVVWDGAAYTDMTEWYLARLMAGDSKYDIWGTSEGIAYWPLASQNGLLPIDDVVGENYWDRLSDYNRFVVDTLKFGGKRYCFALVSDYGDVELPLLLTGLYVMFYNYDMLQKEGTPDPYNLWKEGKWNWDAMGDIFKSITKDTDGDGQLDQWGSAKIFNWLAEPFIRANNAVFAKEDENGKIVYSLSGVEAETALAQLYEWNMVDKVFEPGWDALAAFKSGNIGFMVYPMWNYSAIADGCDFDFRIAPIPQGDNVDHIISPAHGIGGTSLPVNSADPEALMALYEFLYRDDVEILEDAFDEATAMFRNREDLDVALTISEDWSGEIKAIYVEEYTIPELWQTARAVIDDVIFGRKTMSESINAYKPVLQGILDDIFNK